MSLIVADDGVLDGGAGFVLVEPRGRAQVLPRERFVRAEGEPVRMHA